MLHVVLLIPWSVSDSRHYEVYNPLRHALFTKFYELKSCTGILKFKLTFAILANFELGNLNNQSKYRQSLINVL